MLLHPTSRPEGPLGCRSTVLLAPGQARSSSNSGPALQNLRSREDADSKYADWPKHGQCVTGCLRLMGRKLPVSLAMEGKFSREGLQALEEDDDMLTAMARELVNENGVGDSADSVWRQIQAEHCNILAPAAMTPEPTEVIEDVPRTPPLVTPALTVAALVKALKFGSRPLLTRPIQRRDEPPADVQFSLF
jgi:hypothetical protein